MIRLRLLDNTNQIILDTALESFELSYGLNQSTEWSTNLPFNTPGIESIYTGASIIFYLEGVAFFSGVLQSFSPDIVQKQGLRLTGRSRIDELYSTPAYGLAYYEDVPLLCILTELLLQAGWQLGNIGTLEDVDLSLSIDLRGERNLLAQITKVLEAAPFTYWREIDSRLDVGLFNTPSNINLTESIKEATTSEIDTYTHLLTSLTYEIHFPDALYLVTPVGGTVRESGADRVINLGDALSYDQSLSYDPEFPIIEDINTKVWSVANILDYPYPGGQIVSAGASFTGVATYGVGDTVAGAPDENRSLLFTFLPYPGYLEYILLWINGSINLVSEWLYGTNDVIWSIFEVNSDMRTLVGDPLYQEAFTEIPSDNSIYRLTPSTPLLLEPNKLYGLTLHLTWDPVATRCELVLNSVNQTPPANSRFTLRTLDDNDPRDGLVYPAGAITPVMYVSTTSVGAISAGAEQKTESKFAPPKNNSNATSAAIEGAGFGLYQYGKNYLIEHPPAKKTYTAEAIASTTFPKVGDTVFTRARAVAEYYDAVADVAQQKLIESIARSLRVTQLRLRFADEHIGVSYQLIEGEGIPATERLLALYAEVQDSPSPAGDPQVKPWGLVLDTINITINNVSANDTFADGRLCYRVETDIFQGSLSSLPNDTEGVYLAGYPYGISSDGVLRIEVLTEPEFVADSPIVFRVGFTTRDWVYGDSADLVVKLVWR